MYYTDLLHITLLLFNSLAQGPDTAITQVDSNKLNYVRLPNSTQEIAKEYKSAYCSMNDKVPLH
jgi:hypothetical protein